MKNIILILFFLGIGKISLTQWTTTGGDIYYNSGTVAIGTIVPSGNPLYVHRDAGSSAIVYFNSLNPTNGYGLAINTEVLLHMLFMLFKVEINQILSFG